MGKLIGAVLGFYAGGALTALIGLLAGHFFDRALTRAMGLNMAGQSQRIQAVFFDTLFRVMGCIAKADGRVSEAEIAQTEQIMVRLGLSGERRQEAIRRFKEGSAAGFQLQPQISAFVQVAGRQILLRKLLLEALLAVALADGRLDGAEQDVLRQVATALGVSPRDFERLLQMANAQQHFHGGGYHQRSGAAASADALGEAYQALGVSKTATDAEVKKAYRKLMSEHHPDKLMARGVPEEMIKLATEKSQEIQAAYELIKKQRA